MTGGREILGAMQAGEGAARVGAGLGLDADHARDRGLHKAH
jgi:hypothetical protein